MILTKWLTQKIINIALANDKTEKKDFFFFTVNSLLHAKRGHDHIFFGAGYMPAGFRQVLQQASVPNQIGRASCRERLLEHLLCHHWFPLVTLSFGLQFFRSLHLLLLKHHW